MVAAAICPLAARRSLARVTTTLAIVFTISINALAAERLHFLIPAGPGGGLGGAFPGTTCNGAGVVSHGIANAIEMPGPCDPSSGRSVF